MKALVITLGLLMASTAALAKHDGHGCKRGHERAHMQLSLGISDEQAEQMREIRDQGGSREEAHAVLTEEQQDKAEKMREKHQGKRAEHRARIQEHLNLSDEQLEKMDQLREEMRAVLTEEQQAMIENRPGRHWGF